MTVRNGIRFGFGGDCSAGKRVVAYVSPNERFARERCFSYTCRGVVQNQLLCFNGYKGKHKN